jgi:hypothetical protein
MGATRTGKSTLLESMLHFLVEMPTELVRLAVLDMKGGAHLNGYAERASVFATTPEEAHAALDLIVRTIVTPRYDALRTTGRQKIEVPSADEPWWYIVVDEGWKLPPETMELLAQVAREGAAGHVIVIFSTQYMRTEDGFIRSLDVNLSNRLATRLPDATAGAKAMTRAGINASCAPNLIRRSRRTRGIFCQSAGGADPSYSKSWRTHGIADQVRRCRAALRRWGPAPQLVVPAAPIPEHIEEPAPPPEMQGWDEMRVELMQARLDELTGFVAGARNRLVAELITRQQLNRAVNMARRQHDPHRMPTGPERDAVAAERATIERLARELNTDLQDRDSVDTEHQPQPVVA